MEEVEQSIALPTLAPEEAVAILANRQLQERPLSSDFIENIVNLSHIYAAIQHYIGPMEKRIRFPYPDFASIANELYIHRDPHQKRNQLSQEELLRLSISLAGQEPPFIHILRRMSLKKEGFEFTSHLFAPTENIALAENLAPTENRSDRVQSPKRAPNAAPSEKGSSSGASKAYKESISIAMEVLQQAIRQEELSQRYLQELKNINLFEPKAVSRSRFDQQLRRLYLEKSAISKPTGDDLRSLQRINRKLYLYIYRPIILEGLRKKLLIAFSCAELRKSRPQTEDELYDIVHFANHTYLRERLSILCSLLQSHSRRCLAEVIGGEAATEWSREMEQLSGKGRDSADEMGYYRHCNRAARAMLEKIWQTFPKQLATSIEFLIQLLVEIIKLSEWYLQSRKAAVRQREPSELQAFLQALAKAKNLYRLQRKDLSAVECAYLRLILQGKIPGVLACLNPYLSPEKIPEDFDSNNRGVNIFLLKQDRTASARAIESAVQIFKKNGNPRPLWILENILQLQQKSPQELGKYVAPFYLKRLEKTLNRAYLAYLPHWQRLFFYLFNKKIPRRRYQQIYRSRLEREEQQMLLVLKRLN